MRLALSEGRLTKWQDLLEELTYHDLAVLEAYYKIEPWGEARADVREAVMATSISASLSIGEVSGEQFADRVEMLLGYLSPDAEKKQQFSSPNEAAANFRQIFPGK